MAPNAPNSLWSKLRQFVKSLGLWKRVVHLAIFGLSGFAAFLLRFEFSIPLKHIAYLQVAIIVWVVVKLMVFHLYRLDRGWWRFVSLPDLARIAYANLIGSVVSIPVIWLVAPTGFPRSIFVLDLVFCLLATAGVRILARMVVEAATRGELKQGKLTVIYGAGAAGVMLLRESRCNPKLGFTAIGFIDDDPVKRGLLIQGLPVLGSGADLARVIAKHTVEQILIATPSATAAERQTVLQRCHQVGVPCKTVPSMAEVIEGCTLAGQIREVAIDDLLGRNPVKLDQTRIRARIEDKVVLVTGAAGSIGSELCRQIAHFHPRAIIGFEIAETALFYLEREMRESFPGVPFHPEIGSVRDPQRLDEVLERYAPSILYHAAAYKHVPMMEAHLFEAVENNIFGTHNVALAADHHDVCDLVMVSSDKAVRPANIMGVTKRLAELLINSLQNGRTRYVSVRFGNVLGSNGSVIPLFKSQISRGGPVTVTHPEMRRYFMSIPEASQLVLQASTMGHGGEIFVLDMGQPVRIVELARNLILLSGLRPDEDIRIEFTGVRPGEKLYEELSSLEEETLPTYHEKIKIFAGNGLPHDGIVGHLEVLRRCCDERDARRLVLELKEIVPDYNPSTHVLRTLFKPEVPRSTSADQPMTLRRSATPARAVAAGQ